MDGKHIRLFLTDGTPGGILTAEIINWTGKVVSAPRALLAGLALRGEVKRTGVYVLSGEDADSPGLERVYVGEGDIVLQRLKAHYGDESKEFWTRTAVITSSDANLTKAHARYLESRLIERGLAAKRATMVNGTAPAPPPLPEADRSDMEYFLSQLDILLPVLGFGFAQKIPGVPAAPQGTVPIQTAGAADDVADVASAPSVSPLFIFTIGAVTAKAREVEGQFVVLKGSLAAKEDTPSQSKTYAAKRAELVENGLLVSHADNNYLEFSDDVPFPTPSNAAAVVAGHNMNGRKHWKIEGATHQTYGEWKDMLLQQATGTVAAEYENGEDGA